MERIRNSFEGGLLRRMNSVGTMVFRAEGCQWADKYVNYYRLHMAYYLFLTSAGAFVLWLVPLTTSKRMSIISALYTAVSAVATTGLQTVESASLTRLHYCILNVLMAMGSAVLSSLGPILARRYYFHLCIKQFALSGRIQQPNLGQVQHDLQMSTSPTSRENEMTSSEDKVRKLETFGVKQDHGTNKHSKSYSISCEAELQLRYSVKHLQSSSCSTAAELLQQLQHPVKHLFLRSYSMSSSCQPEVLQQQQQHLQLKYSEEFEVDAKDRVMIVDPQQALRTLEYRALVALTRLIVCFWFSVAFMGFLLGSLYLISVGDHVVRILEGRGINPYFFAMFSSISSFSNSGYAMTNDSMIPFVRSSGLLLLYAALVSAGNTLYGPVMRLLIWVCYKRASDKEQSVYEYLLRHPRRCYTYLFPRYQTLWLVGAYILMTGIQIIFMCILEWQSALQGLNPLQKLVASYYQAVSSRNAGGQALSFSQFHPALLLIIAACMYFAAYPVFLSRQTTHVEKSDDYYDDMHILLVGASRKKKKEKTTATATATTVENSDHSIHVLLTESRRLLARDTTYLVFALLVLCFSESQSIKQDPLNFSIFNIMFEMTSAYGNIGLSMGYDCGLRLDQESPCTAIPYSFSGAWSIVGRLTIIVIMIIGKHRDLADNIDSAIRLPTKVVSNAIRSTPPRTASKVSNTPSINFQWNGNVDDFHQPSSRAPSPSPVAVRMHQVSCRPLPWTPSSLPSSPPHMPGSGIESPEVPLSPPPPPSKPPSEVDGLADISLSHLMTYGTEPATETLTVCKHHDPLRLPSETTPDIHHETLPTTIFPLLQPLQMLPNNVNSF